MKTFIKCCLVVFAVLTAHCAAPTETVTGKVVAIADGDTITVLQEENQVKVRLHGVDTPERGQDFGQAAKEYTAERCFGKEVTVVVTDVDRYGRSVGLVILEDGRVLNHELVAAGLAHWYERYARGDESLKRLQQEAKTAKRGLWSRPDAVTPHEFRNGEAASKDRSARTDDVEPFNPPALSIVSPAGVGVPDEGMVYATDTGAKYHREGCRSLRASKRAMTLVEAQKTLDACGICWP